MRIRWSLTVPDIDLNLLVALEALLAERSVTRAARRLGLSPSAMSRTLSRLRRATGDALLVQAGRALVPTAHAEALTGRVQTLAREARAVLRPAGDRLDLAALERTFTIRAGEGFVELLAGALATRLADVAPRGRLRFVPKADKDARPLREGTIDLEIGVLGTTAPEVMSRLLFRDRSVGIARTGHSLLERPVTPERYAACRHVVVSREGDVREPADDALAALGLVRTVPLVVPGYPDAMRIVRSSDLVAQAPRSCLGNVLAADYAAALGLGAFELPVPTPDFVISAIWHPRLDDDPAHRWLRDLIARLCAEAYP